VWCCRRPRSASPAARCTSREGTSAVDVTRAITAAGRYDLGAVQVPANAPARAWDVAVWVHDATLLSQTSFTPGNFACLHVAVSVDASIQERTLSTFTVNSARNWLTLGPRGTRISVFGKSVRVQLRQIQVGGAIVRANPPMSVTCRIEERLVPAPPAQPIVGVVGNQDTSYNMYQLPMFATEFRMDTYPTDTVFLYDNSGAGLVDPFSGVTQLFTGGGCARWRPLHPYAAGIGGAYGAVVETR
jgi:hypothetical protein